ncbi:AsmA family protein [Pseudoduganella sp. FT55W]|uniref:AsmA family protein n=1 Tax=Duganella rivi TaxID=2666083 RepID=A0A7X4GSL6_9BURK|nr:AsmA family protein [Duganella rivi]MYM67874.1 AsmA family protein [Duganella rivi]
MKLSRPLKIVLGLSTALLLVLVAAVIFVLTFDWNRARPWINKRVSESIGREFAINGDLRVRWERGDEAGWRRYVPRPRINAANVSIANPTWTTSGPRLVDIGSIEVALHPLPLLHKEVAITDLAVDKVNVAAQRRADGSNTWTFKDNGPSEWDIDIQRLTLGEGDLRYLDDAIQLDLRAKASGINQDAQQYGLRFDLSGSYRNAPVTGGGKIGKVLALRDEHANFPVQANANLGKNKIAIEGMVTDPRSPAGLDLKLSLAGASMADLYPLTGVLLPTTPPYATTGRLIGKKSGEVWNWTYKNFSGTVGGSDLEGTLAYTPRKPRPLLTGTITSRQLRLEDLGPTIGTNGTAENKALPAEQFNTAKWDALDADVKFSGKKLVRTHDIPLQDIDTHIIMKDKVLTLTPLNFGMAGGDITSNIKLDGRQKQIDAQIRMAARHLKIRQLFPKLESMQASVGEVSADAALAGRGNSVSAMLATSSGEMGATVSEGSVSKFILEAAGLNIANLVFVKLFGDKQIQLNCAAGDFVVENGKAQTRRFVVDTQEAVINVSGNVNMAKETLDLDVRPQTKGVRIISLRTPLYAKGTFTNPDVGPQKGPLALKAGAAVALATMVNPVAAIIPLVNPGKVEPVDCAAALAQANQTRSVAKTQPIKKK